MKGCLVASNRLNSPCSEDVLSPGVRRDRGHHHHRALRGDHHHHLSADLHPDEALQRRGGSRQQSGGHRSDCRAPGCGCAATAPVPPSLFWLLPAGWRVVVISLILSCQHLQCGHEVALNWLKATCKQLRPKMPEQCGQTCGSVGSPQHIRQRNSAFNFSTSSKVLTMNSGNVVMSIKVLFVIFMKVESRDVQSG